MAIYSATPAPRRASSVSAARETLSLWYYRYEVTFCPYMLTPGEKIVVNVCVALLLALLAFSLLYLPLMLLGIYHQAVGLFWQRQLHGYEIEKVGEFSSKAIQHAISPSVRERAFETFNYR